MSSEPKEGRILSYPGYVAPLFYTPEMEPPTSEPLLPDLQRSPHQICIKSESKPLLHADTVPK